jgi:S-adenosylmethionine synthetase
MKTTDTMLHPAEWVLPGHPDKLADAIADALVWEAQRRQPEALCAIEVAVHRDAVFLTGRLACEGSADIDLEEIVRGVYRSAGYGGRWRPAPGRIRIKGNLCLDRLLPEEAQTRAISDDQSIVTGYAVDLGGIGYIPAEQWLARELAHALWQLAGSPLRLCPDGKVLVIVAEQNGMRRLHAVSASLLAPDDVGGVALQQSVVAALRPLLARAAGLIPRFEPAIPAQTVVNGSGSFAIGGPEGDNGLSGKKLLLDYYGPRVPTGGSALSGKDFSKPDRAGALLARRLALVRSGATVEATVTAALYPGDETLRILRIDTPAGSLDGPERWADVIDCRLALGMPWYRAMARTDFARRGHFGHAALPWETFLHPA